MVYVWFIDGAAAPRETAYETKREALSAIFNFNAMRGIQRIKHPKNQGKLYIAKRSK